MFTVSSNKPLDICLLGGEAGKETWPEGRTERESGLPSDLAMDSLPWARHITLPCLQLQAERCLLPLLGGVNTKSQCIAFSMSLQAIESELTASPNSLAEPPELR